MTTEQQAIYLNVVPLLVLGAVYFGAAVSLVPVLARSRRRLRELELALALVFPCGGAAAIAFGLLILRDREPVGGNGWLAVGPIALALVPALAFFARFRDRALLVMAPVQAREAEERRRLHEARTLEECARMLVHRATALLGVEFGALMLVEDEGRVGRGVLACVDGADQEWYSSVRLDLRNEPSGVASAYHDAAPFTVYDARASRRVSHRLTERTGAQSLAYVPLLTGQRVTAVLVLASLAEKRAFTAQEVGRLQALAAEAAPIVERLRDVADLGRGVALTRLATRVRADTDVDEVLREAVEETGRALGADRCFVRVGEPGGDVRVAAEWRLEGLEPIGERAPRLAASNLAIRERRTVAIADIATARELAGDASGGRRELLELGSRSVLAVPLTVFEHVSGALVVHRNSPGAWSHGEIGFLEGVARELAVALHTARLLAENERRVARESALYRVASLLVEPVSLDATRDAIARAAAEAFGGAAAVVGAAGIGSHGVPPQLVAALSAAVGEEDLLTLAAQERRIFASADLADDARLSPALRGRAADAGFRSLLVVPLEASDEVGLVLVWFTDERLAEDDDLELARHLTGAARAALERSERFEAERTSRALAQQLARLGGVLARELDPAAVLDEVVEHAAALLDADACAVRVVDGDDLLLAAAHGVGPELVVGERTPASGWLSAEVAQSRQPVAVDDASSDGALIDADSLLAAGNVAYLGVPLVGAEGTLHGVLAVYARHPRVWRTEEIDALLALAANTSGALSTAELYQRVALEKERSSAILENIADGIVALDREGAVVLWNRAAEQATGVPAAEALGRTPEQVLGRSLSGSPVVPIRRGGDEIWLSVTEAVMRDPAGQVAGRIFACRDVSADRSVEELKSGFVATVSHELRGPLTSIYGFAETLLRQDVLFGDDERRVFLGYVASETERLTGIVDRLLSVARLDAGDLQVNVAATDVAPLLAEVVTSAEANGANGHSFVLDVPNEPLAAEADADKLRQVLGHLVDNAVKYSPNGGRVVVGARRKSDTVEFQVLDEGLGIPAAERERIFRKLYRADSERGGTGVGLFIARKLVNAMGGRIWVESEEGEGSRFAFELPAARVYARGSGRE